MTIGNNIKKLRTAQGLTQDQLAERLFVTRQPISSWERTASHPSLEQLEAIAAALGEDVMTLLYGPKPKYRPSRKRVILVVVLLALAATALELGAVVPPQVEGWVMRRKPGWLFYVIAFQLIEGLLLGFGIGLANGFCVVGSQRVGARDEAGLRRCVAMTMLLSLIVTAVATAASFLGTEPMLRAMNTPENIFSDSAAYIGIIFLGLGASLFYNLFSGLLRAVGDSKTPLYFLCLSSALNVVLDLLFVVTCSMGVAGAAWATILSQGVSALLCLVYMLKKFPILRTGRADWAWHGPMVRRLARMGIPTALSNSVTAIGCMILQVTINGFGSTVVAAYTAASKVEQLTTQPTFTFGLAAATFTAQNAGAGKLDRVKDGVRKATVLNLIAGLAAAVVVWLFAAPITTWFVDPGETAVIAASVQFLNIEAVFILALGVLFVYRNALQGLGNAVMPLISGGVELAMRLAAAILLSRFLGYVGVCLANPVAWTGAAVMLVPAYLAELRRQQNNALARAR